MFRENDCCYTSEKKIHNVHKHAKSYLSDKCVHAQSRSRVRLFVTPWTVWPTRLLCPWDSPGKNTGVDSHVLLQQIFSTYCYYC